MSNMDRVNREFADVMSDLRKNLKATADAALYIHENSGDIGDSSEGKELHEALLKGVQDMMDMDLSAFKMEVAFDKLTSEIRQGEDRLPTEAEMFKMWDAAEKKVRQSKGSDKKHFKGILGKLKNEKPAADDDDDEMEVMQVQHSRKDPISKKDIVTPVINPACNHVYDRDSIEEFAGTKRSIKCAMQGCSETIVIANLTDFPDYWNNVKQPQ